MTSSNEETKFRVTPYMDRTLAHLVEIGKAPNRKKLVSIAAKQHVSWFKSTLEGQKPIQDFVSDLDDDVQWLNLDVSHDYVNTQLQVDSDLDVIRTCDMNSETEAKVNWCASASSISKSGVLRLCVLKQMHNNKALLDEARKMKITERWLQTKNKLKSRTERLIDELYYSFTNQYTQHKLTSDLEKKTRLVIKSHYSRFKETEGFNVLEQHTRGQQVIDVLDSHVVDN
jgi:hypothetical protein